MGDRAGAVRAAGGGDFLGHPRGLWLLFGSEFWERFAYYGMRAFLAVYVAQAFFRHVGEAEAQQQASLAYGGYTSLVYMTGIAGGFVADRILGYQRSILLGGALMAAGLFMLMAPDLTTFLVGLAVIVVGNGLFKPNISTMVGKLYAPEDVRRDSGFTIFYMGINAGAFLAPIVCGTLIGARFGYQWGFFAAGVGMVFGLTLFQFMKHWLHGVGKAPEGREGFGGVAMVLVGALVLVGPVYFLLSKSDVLGGVLLLMMAGLAAWFVTSGIRTSPEQRDRYIAMLLLFVANMCFWALFEQAGSSLNFFAKDQTNLSFFGLFDIHYTVFQSVNALFIIALAPLFAMAWPKLDRIAMNPSTPRKFALGLVQAGLGFGLLVLAIHFFTGADGKVHWAWLVLTYLIHTMGELCLSPIGLAMVTRLAKPEETGLAMGGWFLSIAMGNFVAGRMAALVGSHGADAAMGAAGYATVFQQLFWIGLVMGAVYFVAAPLINRLMHGVR
jgi:POT family proton-dependent oligopeptide transporter